MQSETVKGRALPFVLLRANRFRPQAKYPVVIMLHDYGATMYDVVGIASGMEDRGYIWACPDGPYEVKARWGSGGNAWEMSTENVLPRDDGLSPEELLDEFVIEVREHTGVDEGNMLIAGFGQGGATALSYAVARPRLFRGGASLNGPVTDTQVLSQKAGQDQQFYLALASLDEDFLQRGHATKEALEGAGHSLQFHEYEAPPAPEREASEHDFGEDEYAAEEEAPKGPRLELPDFVTWLKVTLPPY